MLQQHQDRERELQCPFEPSHLIRHYRLAQHIRKCFRNHPEQKKIRCPFDATHVIDPATFSHHMDHCESSGSVWNAIYTTEPDTQVGTIPIEEACQNQPRFLEEDWDGNHSTYDPIKHTEDKGVTRMLQCVPKKERKIFRLKERSRIAALQNQNNGVLPSCPTVVQNEESEAPLRRPKAMPKAISRNSSMVKDTSFSELNDSLVSQFAKSLSIDGRKGAVGKENIGGSRNSSLVEQSFTRNNKIDLEKSTVTKDESATGVEQRANSSFSSIIGKHSNAEGKATESFEKNQSKTHSTYANNSYKSAMGEKEEKHEDSSGDDSSSDSDSSDSNLDTSSREQLRTSMMPRMPKKAYKQCVGRGLTLLFNNNGPIGKHDASLKRKNEKSNTSVDNAEKYGYED